MNLNSELSWVDPKNDPNNRSLLFAKKIFHKQKQNQFVKLSEFNVLPIKQKLESLAPETSLLFNTGGTSGDTKLIQHTYKSMYAGVKSLIDCLQLNELSSWCCLPLHHVAGIMQIIRAKFTGGTVYFLDYRDLCFEIICQEVSHKWISLVPTQLHYLIKNSIACENLRKFKGIFVGGSRLSEKLAIECRSLELPLYPTYGMTETAGMVTILKKADFLNGMGGVGKPLPHSSLKLEEESNKILVKSESTAPNLKVQALKSGWFQTPDFGRVDDRGNWWIDGRLDRILITGGKKVNPDKIERILLNTGLIEGCLIKGEKSEVWGDCITAFITPKDTDLENLKTKALKILEAFEVPKKWQLVENLPLSEMGKPK